MKVLCRSLVTGKEVWVPEHYLTHPILGQHWQRVTDPADESPEPQVGLVSDTPGGNLEAGSPEPAHDDSEGEQDAENHR